MELDIYQVDAFTFGPFTGNPAAVILLDDWLPHELLQKIAEENNLSETAYIIKQGYDYHIRWFTPEIEVDLCGHATLASAYVLFNELNFNEKQLLFNSKSGKLRVEKIGESFQLDFPTDDLKVIELNEEIKNAFNIQPVEAFVGRDDYLIILENEEAVRKLNSIVAKLNHIDIRGFIISAPGDNSDFVSRCFFPNAGIPEDPVTGSAHTTLTPYWAKRLNKNELSAKQLSKRGGELLCKFDGERTYIKGKANLFLKGKIYL